VTAESANKDKGRYRVGSEKREKKEFRERECREWVSERGVKAKLDWDKFKLEKQKCVRVCVCVCVCVCVYVREREEERPSGLKEKRGRGRENTHGI
jgi:hypothetical protein